MNTHRVLLTANRLHSEGTEMQLSMQHAIMSFKQQSDLATTTNTDLQLINRKAYEELTEYNAEIESLRQQLTMHIMRTRLVKKLFERSFMNVG